MPSEKVPLRLQDIIENAQAVFRYVEGMDLAAFMQDRKTYDAVERCLARLGEAVAKLGDLGPTLLPDQPCRKIKSFGNILRHEYDGIEDDGVFDIVKNHLPSLCAAAEDAVKRFDGHASTQTPGSV